MKLYFTLNLAALALVFHTIFFLANRVQKVESTVAALEAARGRNETVLQLLAKERWYVQSATLVSDDKYATAFDYVSVDLRQSHLAQEISYFGGQWVRFSLKTGTGKHDGDVDDPMDMLYVELVQKN